MELAGIQDLLVLSSTNKQEKIRVGMLI